MSFRLRQHPRICNKPLRCRNGLHGPWETIAMGGQPMLVCKGCGASIFKGVKEHTYAKREYQKVFKPYEEAHEQRRSMLRQKILEAMKVDY